MWRSTLAQMLLKSRKIEVRNATSHQVFSLFEPCGFSGTSVPDDHNDLAILRMNITFIEVRVQMTQWGLLFWLEPVTPETFVFWRARASSLIP